MDSGFETATYFFDSSNHRLNVFTIMVRSSNFLDHAALRTFRGWNGHIRKDLSLYTWTVCTERNSETITSTATNKSVQSKGSQILGSKIYTFSSLGFTLTTGQEEVEKRATRREKKSRQKCKVDANSEGTTSVPANMLVLLTLKPLCLWKKK